MSKSNNETAIAFFFGFMTGVILLTAWLLISH